MSNKKHTRICSHCSKPGHNIRTCPELREEPIKKPVKRQSKQRICSYCNKPGHNRRTCLKLKLEDEVCIKVEKTKEKVKTKFKDEDEFLNCVLNLEYSKLTDGDIIENPECLCALYFRDRKRFQIIKSNISEYNLLVDGNKYIEIIVKGRFKYSFRRGEYGIKTKYKTIFSKNLECEINNKLLHYSKKYKLVE